MGNCFAQTLFCIKLLSPDMYRLFRYVGCGWEVQINSNAPHAVTAARITELSPSSARYLHSKFPPAENPTAYFKIINWLF
jgi:hypothetical protein